MIENDIGSGAVESAGDFGSDALRGARYQRGRRKLEGGKGGKSSGFRLAVHFAAAQNRVPRARGITRHQRKTVFRRGKIGKIHQVAVARSLSSHDSSQRLPV